MAVVSPTGWPSLEVEDTAMAMIIGTGLIFSRLEMAMATGATISTVATLSTKAEMSPANRAQHHHGPLHIGHMGRRISAIRAGIRDSMNRDTMPMVPAIIHQHIPVYVAQGVL